MQNSQNSQFGQGQAGFASRGGNNVAGRGDSTRGHIGYQRGGGPNGGGRWNRGGWRGGELVLE